MTQRSKKYATYLAMALLAVLLVVLVVALVKSAQRSAANRRAQQMVKDQAAKAHSDQQSWALKLPEVYTVTAVASGKPKKTTTSFQYTMVKSPQSMNKEVVVADEATGQLAIDQSDAAVMTPGFKCNFTTPCAAFATDAAGDSVYSGRDANGGAYYYGLVKGKSIIRITTRRPLSSTDALAVVNSLKLATTAERSHLRTAAP